MDRTKTDVPDRAPQETKAGFLKSGTVVGFKRWLKRGLLSGTPAGVIKGVADVLFFLCFSICFGWEYINTTMFKKGFSDALETRMDSLYHIAVVIIFLCAVVSILLQDSLGKALFAALLIAAGFLHWKLGAGRYEYFVLCVMTAGMTERSFRTLLKFAFAIGVSLSAAAFAASQLGIIEDLVYEGGRHSFGIIYCTDCAAHILFLMIMYVMLRLEYMHIVEFIALVLTWAIMLMTKAQSDIVCGFLLLAGIFFYRLTRRFHQKRFIRPIFAGVSFSYVFCMAASFIVTLGFDRTNRKMRSKLQYSLIRRLEMNQEAIQQNPFSLFGTKIEEHGFGGRTTNLPGWDKYFFIDCSYIRLYVIGGVILFIMILLLMTYAQLRCFICRQYGYVLLLALVAIACLMEHHLMEYYYNVFPLAAFAQIRSRRERSVPARGKQELRL